MTLGEFIKKTREEKELSQENVAEAGNLARSYISKLEDDNYKSPSAMVLIRLAKGLGVSHETIFQVAGYLPRSEKSKLPSFDVYLRTKYPHLSEKAIKDIEFYKDVVGEKYKKK